MPTHPPLEVTRVGTPNLSDEALEALVELALSRPRKPIGNDRDAGDSVSCSDDPADTSVRKSLD